MIIPESFDGIHNERPGYRQNGEPMPKRVLPLTDAQVKNAKPKAKEYKLADGGGLYLLVPPTGGKLWRFDYRFNDKRKTLTFKTYPEISLSDARRRRDDARKLVTNGVDPGDVKKAQKAIEQARGETFKTVTLEWHNQKKAEWSDNHAERLLRRLELDIFPFIGDKPIADIRTPAPVDYQEQPEAGMETRWLDRVIPDGTWSGNLFDFYRRVVRKLVADLKVPFVLKGYVRQDDTPVHRALREALVNSLVHADQHGASIRAGQQTVARVRFSQSGAHARTC